MTGRRGLPAGVAALVATLALAACGGDEAGLSATHPPRAWERAPDTDEVLRLCRGPWSEPGGSMRFVVADARDVVDALTWDGHRFGAVPVVAVSAGTGAVARADLQAVSARDGSAARPRAVEWLDFHVSGAHGDRIDRAYIRRDVAGGHHTLNPGNPVVPDAC